MTWGITRKQIGAAGKSFNEKKINQHVHASIFTYFCNCLKKRCTFHEFHLFSIAIRISSLILRYGDNKTFEIFLFCSKCS